MEKERLQEILQNALNWAYEHNSEFVGCMLKAMKLTEEEKKELGIEEEEK